MFKYNFLATLVLLVALGTPALSIAYLSKSTLAALGQPSGPIKFVTLGSGKQLYQCQKDGTWKHSGAIADLFDISNKPELWRTLTNTVSNSGHNNHPVETITKDLQRIGSHKFVANKAGQKPDFVPRFDIYREYVIALKDKEMPSPLKRERNVPWLSLKATEGTLARSVYRVSTRGGAPPPGKCQPDSIATPKYNAIYMFFS